MTEEEKNLLMVCQQRLYAFELNTRLMLSGKSPTLAQLKFLCEMIQVQSKVLLDRFEELKIGYSDEA